MATKKTKPPILPRNYQDPTGADALERRAMKDFAGRMNKIGKAYKSALNKIPSSLAVNARYEYQLNPMLLSIILNDASYRLIRYCLKVAITTCGFTSTSIWLRKRDRAVVLQPQSAIPGVRSRA